MGSIRGSRSTVRSGAVALVVALALAGCSAGPTEEAGNADRADSAAKAPAGAGPGVAEQQGQPAAGDPVRYRADERAIIYTGSMTVRVENVERAAARAATIVTGAGGFVGGDKRTSGDSDAEASLELRVPAAKFGQVVDEIAGLGDPERRDIATQDVTEESLDLDARIATQRARVESGRRLLAQAKNLNDLVMLEGELAKREADLASLEAKKRRLADLTALSTITAVLLGPGTHGAGDEGQPGFVAGVKGGWKALVASLAVLLTVLGALLPWLVALGVPVAGVVWLALRLNRRRRPLPPPA
ncbi:DUF4349 domain-containing protein [Micromonospora sp. NPDC049679]|uniref:DUF4349 domain-containing protein n=1 Tax=Micromonospora sp. NPDC049679 TaxID=3155920 RepID=UPI0034040E5D